MLKMLHIWMLPHVVYGGVTISRFSWMLRILEVPRTGEGVAEEL